MRVRGYGLAAMLLLASCGSSAPLRRLTGGPDRCEHPVVDIDVTFARVGELGDRVVSISDDYVWLSHGGVLERRMLATGALTASLPGRCPCIGMPVEEGDVIGTWDALLRVRPDGTVAWRFPHAPGVMLAPVRTEGGRLLVAINPSEASATAVVLDVASGAELWRTARPLAGRGENGVVLVHGRGESIELDWATGAPLRTRQGELMSGEGYLYSASQDFVRLPDGATFDLRGSLWLPLGPDAEGNVWLDMDWGLVSFSPTTGEVTHAMPASTALDARLVHGRVVYATDSSVLIFDNTRWLRPAGLTLPPDPNPLYESEWDAHGIRGGLLLLPRLSPGSTLQAIVIWTDIFDRSPASPSEVQGHPTTSESAIP